MKEKIIEKAIEMFLNLGFKSVTMDDLANELAISKKTIYQHFANKTKLVEATTAQVFEAICQGIEFIRAENKNPIEELFTINNFAKQYLKNEKSSPQYQLQKYYPKIFEKLKDNQFCVMHECVEENLLKGVSLGLYREEIDVKIIARIYFLGVMGIKDRNVFPLEMFSPENILNTFLEYHMRGIVTEKGKKELIKHINT